MVKPTLGSLFDGIGGFPLAAIHNGIIPVWASEIEAFPIAVTKIRFPSMIHMGDITKLNGADIPTVDVICGGSPCQDLSVAGKRQGLAGKRSGLFMEQVRIVKEMREASGGRDIPDDLVRPRYLVWENVPGAFSSTGGEDFRAVLEEIVRVKEGSCHVPRSDTGRWEPAGVAILGNQFSLAWRVLDAQYWGVAQRRRRIFLVADFGGLTAPEILFKQDSLFGNPSPDAGEGTGIASSAKGSADDTGRADLSLGKLRTQPCEDRKTVSDGLANIEKVFISGNTQGVLFDNHGIDSRYSGPHAVAPTVMACYGTGGNNVPLVAGEQGSYCISGNMIDREVQNGGNGLGCRSSISYTLTATDRHAVYSCQHSDEFRENDAMAPQSVRQHKDTTDLICQPRQSESQPTRDARYEKILNSEVGVSRCDAETRKLIRRLTPLECERLQGFPDGWTDICGASDSARYKALGNSVAIPCVDFVLRGIACFLRKMKQDYS